MTNNNHIPKRQVYQLAKDLVKGQLRTERMAKENAERLAEAIESWTQAIMKLILPEDIFIKSKLPMYQNQCAEWLQREGYHYSVIDDGWTYILKHKDQEISRLEFNKPETTR